MCKKSFYFCFLINLSSCDQNNKLNFTDWKNVILFILYFWCNCSLIRSMLFFLGGGNYGCYLKKMPFDSKNVRRFLNTLNKLWNNTPFFLFFFTFLHLINIINAKVRLFVTLSRKNYSTDLHETLDTHSWRYQK